MTTTKAKRGRPHVENGIDGHLNIRMDTDTMNALVVLASNWECPKSVAVRRAIREAVKWDAKK